ncbi:MAG: response regulator transcription factor [Anaerolineae bacterium]|nr:response regulator transcription factor [Anaerolineae bacterium]
MNVLFGAGQDTQTLFIVQQTFRHPFSLTLVGTEAFLPAFLQDSLSLVIWDVSHLSTPQVSDGVQAMRGLEAGQNLPLLALTSASSACEVARLLDTGLDDVLRKPLQTQELRARARALLRWYSAPGAQEAPDLRLDPLRYQALVNEKCIQLTPIEFHLLDFLCQNRSYHTSQALLEALWHPPDGPQDTALVRNHIRNLRCKLERDPNRPRLIVSHYGRGYKVQANVQRA